MEERSARVRAIAEVAPGVLHVELEPVYPPDVRFRGGQFVSVRIGPGYHPRRSYSIASSPIDATSFALLVKTLSATAGGFFSSLTVGDELQFNGPMGFFTLTDDHPGDVVMAATGVGISAVLSQIHELLARGGGSKVHLFWGLNHPRERFATDELDALAAGPRFSYEIWMADPAPGWSGPVGFITDPVLATADTLVLPTYYLCGNGAMVADVRRGLADRGVPAERVRTEVFYPRIP